MKPTQVRREPTVWTRRLQLLTAAVSVVTTIGTAIVLGYVSPHMLAATQPDLSPAEISDFLVGYRMVGVTFLVANAIGILALWNKAWIHYLVVVVGLAEGIGFLAMDRAAVGLQGLGDLATIVTDGGGGLLSLVLLGFLVRYRTAWAHRRVVGSQAADRRAARVGWTRLADQRGHEPRGGSRGPAQVGVTRSGS